MVNKKCEKCGTELEEFHHTPIGSDGLLVVLWYCKLCNLNFTHDGSIYTDTTYWQH